MKNEKTKDGKIENGKEKTAHGQRENGKERRKHEGHNRT